MNLISLAASQRIAIDPVISTSGPVPAWARDMEISNPFFSFWVIDRGRVKISWSGGRCVVRAGSGILIPCGLRRHHVFSDDCRIVSLSFWASWHGGLPLLLSKRPLIAGPAAARDLRKPARAAAALVAEYPRRLSEALLPPMRWLRFFGAVEMAVSSILEWAGNHGGVWSFPESGDARLNHVLQSLHDAPSAGPLPFDRWREETGLGRVQLERLAHQWTGQTLKARRDAILLGEIQKSLPQEKESLKELAARLGFCDPPHFTRWVRAQTGRTPKNLRHAWARDLA